MTVLSTQDLFDRSIEFESRLEKLIAWIDAKRGVPTERAEALLLAHLLATDAVTLPLHQIFPDEEAMDLSLCHPWRKAEEDPVVDEVSLLNFIWRHSTFSPDTVEQLQACARKYEAIIGLVSWDVAFESEDEFKKALEKYEIVTRLGVDGEIVHEDEVFWYVAARDYGISQEDADMFNRLSMIYLFSLGIALDDVGVTVLE